jgi:ferredoxin-NADP reductase/ferredoxin
MEQQGMGQGEAAQGWMCGCTVCYVIPIMNYAGVAHMLKLKSIDFEQQQFEIHKLDAHTDKLEWVIGRNPNCDLVLSSLDISRVHGRIVYCDNAYHFIDAGSTSGSMLNGELVPVNEKRLLQVGNLLQIGETFLYVEELTPPSVASGAASTLGSSFSLPQNQWTTGDLQCRCCRIVDETADVKTFCFVAEPPLLFSYKPGQFVNLEVEINGRRVVRPYSISSSPTRPYHLNLTIKRVPASSHHPALPPGLVSNWLHDHIKVGDRVKLLGGPLGQFTCLPDLPSKLLLISAGSGITPMMSMSRWVQDTLAECDIVFLHSARTPEDIVFRTELEAMAAQMPNFHLAVTLTQPALTRSWMGLTGRISEAMLDLVVPDLLDRAVFVCGPEQFMASVKSMLQAMGFPMQNYKEESFGGRKILPSRSTPSQAAPSQAKPASKSAATSLPPAAQNGRGHHLEGLSAIAPEVLPPTAPPAAPPAAPAVKFAKSGQEILTDGSLSILELAEQEGISIRSACRVGACGACKVRTHQGQLRYDSPPQALSAADQQAGYALACVAHPVNRLVVEA